MLLLGARPGASSSPGLLRLPGHMHFCAKARCSCVCINLSTPPSSPPQAYSAAQAASEKSAAVHSRVMELMAAKAETEDKMRRLEVRA